MILRPGLAGRRPAPEHAGSSFVPMILIFGIFYFLLIAPDAQAPEGAAADDRQRCKKGDRVVTTGGLYGEVAGDRRAASVILKIADNVKVQGRQVGDRRPRGAKRRRSNA